MFRGALVVAILLGSPSAAAQPPAATRGDLLLTGGTVYPSPEAEPITDAVVVVRDGEIAAVGGRGAVPMPDGVTTIDCRGRTIVAGFWNSHVHFLERKWAEVADLPAAELAGQLRAMLTRYGFTSVFDLGSALQNTLQLRARIESGEVPGPRIRTTGELLIGKGSAPPDTMLRLLGLMVVPLPEVTGADDARAVSRELLAAGADGVKLYAASAFPPYATLPADAIRAAVDEAHRRHRPAFAHPQSRAGLLAALAGGVDVVAHTTPQDGPWDDAVLAAMRQANVAVIPTLKLWPYQMRHDRASRAEALVQASTGQLRAWVAAGGVVLFGTDVGAGIDDYDPSDEYALMGQAGMTFRQILAALTTAPAARFGVAGQLGRIAPGLDADLVLLDGDPARDVRAFASVRCTIRDGTVIYRHAQ